MGKLFGTDGIRGAANHELTPELVLAVGRAGALMLNSKAPGRPLLIGRDPRLSGQMLEGALVGGITSVGLDVIIVDVVPTPAVAYLAKEFSCSGGIMISASHNPFQDNGIKFFGPDGYKLTEEMENQIEALVAEPQFTPASGGNIGRVIRRPEAGLLYLQHLQKQVPVDLRKLHLAVDSANGATSAYAARLFRELGAQVSSFYDQPNGININHFCGSTYPEKIQALVKETGADLGFAFDGDGDRILAIDECGNVLNGDSILAVAGLHLLKNDQLPARTLIATSFSNGGLRQTLVANGGDVKYAPVGDRHVLEAMIQEGCILGGEQSGHILFLENSTTGDGMLTALKLLEIRQLQQTNLAKLAQDMQLFPQRLVNVPVKTKEGWQMNPKIKGAMEQAVECLAPLGRLVVRASGTESMIRVLAEHPEAQTLDKAIQLVVSVIKTEQGNTRDS